MTILQTLMRDKIDPFLNEIVTKSLDNGSVIYSCTPVKGVKVIPTGYFKTEDEAIEAFYNELVKINRI